MASSLPSPGAIAEAFLAFPTAVQAALLVSIAVAVVLVGVFGYEVRRRGGFGVVIGIVISKLLGEPEQYSYRLFAFLITFCIAGFAVSAWLFSRFASGVTSSSGPVVELVLGIGTNWTLWAFGTVVAVFFVFVRLRSTLSSSTASETRYTEKEIQRMAAEAKSTDGTSRLLGGPVHSEDQLRAKLLRVFNGEDVDEGVEELDELAPDSATGGSEYGGEIEDHVAGAIPGPDEDPIDGPEVGRSESEDADDDAVASVEVTTSSPPLPFRLWERVGRLRPFVVGLLFSAGAFVSVVGAWTAIAMLSGSPTTTLAVWLGSAVVGFLAGATAYRHLRPLATGLAAAGVAFSGVAAVWAIVPVRGGLSYEALAASLAAGTLALLAGAGVDIWLRKRHAEHDGDISEEDPYADRDVDGRSEPRSAEPVEGSETSDASEEPDSLAINTLGVVKRQIQLWKMDAATAASLDELLVRFVVPSAVTAFAIFTMIGTLWVHPLLYIPISFASGTVGSISYLGFKWKRRRNVEKTRSEGRTGGWRACDALSKRCQTERGTEFYCVWMAGRRYFGFDKHRVARKVANRWHQRLNGDVVAPAIHEHFAESVRSMMPLTHHIEHRDDRRGRGAIYDCIADVIREADDLVVPKMHLAELVSDSGPGPGHDPDIIAEVYEDMAGDALEEFTVLLRDTEGEERPVTLVTLRNAGVPLDLENIQAEYSNQISPEDEPLYELPEVEATFDIEDALSVGVPPGVETDEWSPEEAGVDQPDVDALDGDTQPQTAD